MVNFLVACFIIERRKVRNLRTKARETTTLIYLFQFMWGSGEAKGGPERSFAQMRSLPTLAIELQVF